MAADDASRRKSAEREREGTPASTGARPNKSPRTDEPPAAGPHATPELSNPEATPGAGALQTPGAKEDMGSTG